MKILSRIIRSLNKEEIRGFRLFADRIQSEKYDRKAVELFDLLRSGKYEENDKSIVQKLYDNSNSSAYYRLKNRLKGDLERSLLLQHHRLDDRVKIYRLIMLGRLFMFKSEYSVSHEYYLKASKLANKLNLIDMEVVICEELQLLANYYSEVNLPEIIHSKLALIEKHFNKQKVDSLLEIVSYRLKQSNFDGRNQELLHELETIQHSLEIYPNQQDPEIRFKIHKCVRESLLGKKDFKTLEKYLIKSYEDFLQDDMFDVNNHREKIVILSWIVNTLIKNRRLEASLAYTEELLSVLKEHKGLHYQQYIWTYYQGLVLYYSGSGQPQKGIELLEKVQTEMLQESIPVYHIFIVLNLARLYFDLKEYAPLYHFYQSTAAS